MLHVGVLPNHRHVGRRAGQPRLDRGGRGARLPRRVRLARGQRAAAAAAAGAAPTAPSRASCSRAPRSPTRVELAERLTGLEMQLVDRDGAPRAERQIAMWNPPLRGREARHARRRRCPRRPSCWPSWWRRDVRTICFLKSRRGVELIQRFTRLRLEDAGRADLAERIAPYRAGYTPDPAARDRAAAGGGRAAGRGRHQRARAGHRRRRPRRRDLRDVPGHGRQPAPDVGPRRAARAPGWRCTWPATTRSTSSSAATRTSSSTGRWSRRSSTTSPRRSTSPTWPPPPTSCRCRPTTRTCFGAALGALRASGWSARAAARARRALPAARRGLPGGARSRCAPPSPDSVAVVEADGGEVIGTVEAGARALGRPPGRRLPAHGTAPTRSRSSTCAAGARWSGRFAGDWYTQPKKETDTCIEQVRERARVLRRRAVVRDRVGDRAGDRLPEEARHRPRGARPAGARHARAAAS